jgi:Uma2 family endonuclease
MVILLHSCILACEANPTTICEKAALSTTRMIAMSTAITADPSPLRLAGGLDDAEHYEIIDGRRVELPPMSALATIVASNLNTAIDSFAKHHRLGRAVVGCLIKLPPPVNRSRRPDVAFASFQRWAADRPLPLEEIAWEVVPDLAVEVISPTDLGEDLLEKIEEYFRAGVRQVWVVYPRLRMIQIYESLQVIRGLTASDELSGGAILPEYRLPVKSLFE